MAGADPAPAASWAAVATKPAVKQEDVSPADTVSSQSTAVVDANAIVSGIALRSLAERLVTVPEVLAEVRDPKSREFLAAQHVELQTLEPNEDSIAAVTRFARATGDLHSLSAVDIKLIALAHMLEVAAYGPGHLRDLPAPPRVRGKQRGGRGRNPPGWGQAGGTWTAMDRLDADAEAAAAAAISTAGGEASAIDDGNAAHDEASGAAGAQEVATASPSDAAQDGGVSHIAAGVQAIDLSRETGLGLGTSPASSEDDSDSEEAASMEDAADPADRQPEGGAADDDGWEVAATSKSSARRHKRKHFKRLQREEAMAAMAIEEAAASVVDDEGSEWMSDDGSDDGSADGSAAPTEALLESTSNIVSVTADFSMQNVILQMGLRLATPDGRRISHVSRFVLRCQACFFITKEVGRLFCPQCGNATMDKVEVTINAEGQEQYGIRKKHNLRGTRFSLPKPKGGRQKGVPILREDVMLQRLPHMRPKKQEEIDPFAPERAGADFWFQKGGDTKASERHAKGTAAILASWKHNPNERKHVRTNRRRK